MKQIDGVTILDFQEKLGEKVKQILRDVQSSNTAGETVDGVNIYDQFLPVVTEDDEDESQFFPFVIVRVLNGKTDDDDDPWTVTTILILGIYDTDAKHAGSKRIMIMIQRLINEFAAEPLLAKTYRAMPDPEWDLQDEDTYPFYYGAVQFKFKMPKIGRREPIYG